MKGKISSFLVALYLCGVTASYADSASKELQEVLNIKNIKDEKAKESIGEWISEKFGLAPYKPNYLLPFGYAAEGKYKMYTATDDPYKEYEAEFQVSFKLAVKKNVLGFGEVYYAAYSQRSFWQLYIESSPFRESNYNPELFVVFPTGSNEYYGLKSIELGYSHLSNGQGNIDKTKNADLYPEFDNRSRSINSLYMKYIFQQKSFIFDIKFWMPVGPLDDNPDILDYYGYGRLRMLYFYKKHVITLMGRLNPITQKGAAEFTYSYPGKLDGVYLFFKAFSGYGESLIDYDNYITKYSVGFSFSR